MYEKQTWNTGDVITEEKLNHMEDGIALSGSSQYEKQTWATGDVITEEKLNHMEDGIANAGGSSQTHTATITGQGDASANHDKNYLIFGGQTIVNAGTFTFKSGDVLQCCVQTLESGHGSVNIDSQVVLVTDPDQLGTYDFELPDHDIEIRLIDGHPLIDITFPTIFITSNGLKDIEGYIRADVDVSFGFRTLSVTNNRSTGSATYKRVSFIGVGKNELDDKTRTDDVVVTGGSTKDVKIPLPNISTSSQQNEAQYVLMWGANASLEPTVTSDYCSLVGTVTDGARRVSILKIVANAPDNISLTVGE